MIQPYSVQSLLDTFRIDLRGIEESIEFWKRPGAMAGVVTLGGEIKDGTEQHLRDLQRAAQHLRDLIASIEAKHG